MEVTQISPYRFNSPLKLKHAKLRVPFYAANNQISNICYKPLFTGVLSDEEKLKNISEITCACCGCDFVSKEEYRRLGSLAVTQNSKTNIQELSKYQHKMEPVEKQIFDILKDFSKKFPQENFQELLQRANVEHLPKLENYQKNILNSVKKDSLELSPHSQEIVMEALDDINEILFEEPKEIPQKRYRAIQIFDTLFNSFVNNNELGIFDKMCDKIIALPSSGQNVDAFIAKYCHRSPREISQRLLISALPTIEHVVATSNNGKDEINNKIIFCKNCNKERSSDSYSVFVKKHPEMKENLQIYIDKVIKQINSGELTGINGYPFAIKNLFEKKNIGLNLDISKLSPNKQHHQNSNKTSPTEVPPKEQLNQDNKYKQNLEDFKMEHSILCEVVSSFKEEPTSVKEKPSIFTLNEQKSGYAQNIKNELEQVGASVQGQPNLESQLKKLNITKKRINRKLELLNNLAQIQAEIIHKKELLDKIQNKTQQDKNTSRQLRIINVKLKVLLKIEKQIKKEIETYRNPLDKQILYANLKKIKTKINLLKIQIQKEKETSLENSQMNEAISRKNC